VPTQPVDRQNSRFEARPWSSLSPPENQRQRDAALQKTPQHVAKHQSVAAACDMTPRNISKSSAGNSHPGTKQKNVHNNKYTVCGKRPLKLLVFRFSANVNGVWTAFVHQKTVATFVKRKTDEKVWTETKPTVAYDYIAQR